MAACLLENLLQRALRVEGTRLVRRLDADARRADLHAVALRMRDGTAADRGVYIVQRVYGH